MKILVINWQDLENPRAGGAEIHLHEVFGRLAGWGHRVTLLASGWPGAPERAEADGIAIHRAGGRHTFSIASVRRYLEELAGEEWDIVVEDQNKIPLFTPLWIRSPLVLLVHHLFGASAFEEASFPFAAATWLLERPIPWLYRGLPTVAVSESTRRDLVRRGLRREDIRVIHNGVDLEAYRPAGDEEGRFPEPTVLYVGRLKRYKRVDLPIRAVARLREEGVGVRMLVAGKGDHRPELERVTAELGLEGSVRFLGFVPEEEKRELLRRSWVHVLTSPKEGWGIANLEAAASATPTVASDSPGLRDSVVDGETGFLVPHGDVGSLARRIRELVEDPPLREELGRAGRSFAEAHAWKKVSRRFEAFLEDVVRRADG